MRLSPLNARRLANFRANRRGYWSLWLFTLLLVLSLFADLIANDNITALSPYKKPWLCAACATKRSNPALRISTSRDATASTRPLLIKKVSAR